MLNVQECKCNFVVQPRPWSLSGKHRYNADILVASNSVRKTAPGFLVLSLIKSRVLVILIYFFLW